MTGRLTTLTPAYDRCVADLGGRFLTLSCRYFVGPMGLDARLLGAVLRLDDEEGYDPCPGVIEFERRYFVQPHIDALAAENFVSEQALGATMTQQQAIELAQSLVERSV